jgi:hypothetical protein
VARNSPRRENGTELDALHFVVDGKSYRSTLVPTVDSADLPRQLPSPLPAIKPNLRRVKYRERMRSMGATPIEERPPASSKATGVDRT